MKTFLCLLVCVTVALAMPQREGATFTNEAIRQAQTSLLIPKDAQIQNVILVIKQQYHKFSRTSFI